MGSSRRTRPVHLTNVTRHNTPTILFVTVCAADRAVNTFANVTMQGLLRKAWEQAGSHRVGAYVLMPDHLHLFCAPASPEAENVAKWVQYWKSLVTRTARTRASGGVCGGDTGDERHVDEQTLVPPILRTRLPSGEQASACPDAGRRGRESLPASGSRGGEACREGQASACPPVFQRDCWDTQLRRGESYHDKWEYVRNNPVRRGLAESADTWPYWGVINELVW